jgi:hypothetical protein
MTSPLVVEAIRSLRLQDGKVTVVEVDGRNVEVTLQPQAAQTTVAPATSITDEAPPYDDDWQHFDGPAYIVPWVDLFQPGEGEPVPVIRSNDPLPIDIPDIPDDDEEPTS